MNDTTDLIATSQPAAAEKKHCSIADLSVGADYDVTLTLSDKKGQKSSECTHHFKGSSKHDLMNLLAICGLAAAGAVALSCLVNAVCGCRR
ncbi:MAG: hypothetical protein IJ011_04805 [Clostridia bacterium]|nr:hypothetical protein [Clostridia bacterium]